MKLAVFYYGSLNSDFARKQDWSKFDLGVFACNNIDILKSKLRVFSYTHKGDSEQKEKFKLPNNGLFLDYATAPKEYINNLADILHKSNRQLIVNTGWGTHMREDYGRADTLLFESFLGTHSGDDKKWPAKYFRRDEAQDMKKLRLLKRNYKVITMTYGPSTDKAFARKCFEKAKESDYFVYTQYPLWEAEDSGFELFSI